MDADAAHAWLESHVNLEVDVASRSNPRRLDRLRHLLTILSDPQAAYPVIHITGTNGKGSTARFTTALLRAAGLSVGTYTSPHLERLNERIAWSGEPISDEDLAAALTRLAGLEGMLTSPLTHFEILTAAAFTWFADIAVDVAVVEVGLGGRRDCTNVADGRVAVVTNVSLDHVAAIGPTLAEIATEKAGIVKPGSTLILGTTDPELSPIFRAAGAAEVWARDNDFGLTGNRLAVGGRSLDLYSPSARYEDVYLPVHGRYQGENASAALAAVEAFLGAPLGSDLVRDALAAITLPGRLEVVGRRPLCILDGAHNPAGAAAAGQAIDEAFGAATGRVLVVGMRQGRDPAEMLAALRAPTAGLVVACPAPTPKAIPAAEIAQAAAALACRVVEAASVAEAVDTGLAEAGDDDLVLVTGSLYVVGAARGWLSARRSDAMR